MVYTLIIKKNKTLKYILKKGKYSNKKHLAVHCIINNKVNNKNFFAVCVSKKNGNSVQRNKLKRWAREVYKNEEVFLKRGYNIVILYKKTTTAIDIDYNIVKAEISKCFEELGLYEK